MIWAGIAIGALLSPVLIVGVGALVMVISDHLEDSRWDKRHAEWMRERCRVCNHLKDAHIYRMVDWDPFNSYYLCPQVTELDGYQWFNQPSKAESSGDTEA